MSVSSDPWSDFLRVVAGAFTGALLAFLSNLWLQRRAQRRLDLAAGNLALIILAQQLSDLLLIKRALEHHVQTILGKDSTTPRWAQLWPWHFHFSDGLKFDYNSLSFLSLIGKGNVISRLAHAEQLYFDLSSVLTTHAETVAAIQEQVATRNLAALPWDEMTTMIGVHLTSKAAMLTDGLFSRSERNPGDITKAIEELRKALVMAFGETNVVKVDTNPQIRHLSAPGS